MMVYTLARSQTGAGSHAAVTTIAAQTSPVARPAPADVLAGCALGSVGPRR